MIQEKYMVNHQTKAQVFSDAHTHIGHFYQTHYEYQAVFGALASNGIREITCAYLTPKFDDAVVAGEFYTAVLQELKSAQLYAHNLNVTVHFLAWLDPLVIKKFSLEKIWNDFDYAGFALHPVLHNWHGTEAAALTRIFRFAQKNNIHLYIHTGVSENDHPMLFER